MAVDVEKIEVLVIVIMDDCVRDGRVFKELVERVLARGIVVRRVLADGAYDTREAFDLLDAPTASGWVKLKRDASMRLMGGSLARPRAVQELNRLGFEAWASKYAYWKRWTIEYVFSAVKRTLGGEVRARRRDLMFF